MCFCDLAWSDRLMAWGGGSQFLLRLCQENDWAKVVVKAVPLAGGCDLSWHCCLQYNHGPALWSGLPHTVGTCSNSKGPNGECRSYLASSSFGHDTGAYLWSHIFQGSCRSPPRSKRRHANSSSWWQKCQKNLHMGFKPTNDYFLFLNAE